MSCQIVFRVSTGQSLDGDAPGTGGAMDISKKLSLVGSIPELGAWSLNRRIPVRTNPDLGEPPFQELLRMSVQVADAGRMATFPVVSSIGFSGTSESR